MNRRGFGQPGVVLVLMVLGAELRANGVTDRNLLPKALEGLQQLTSELRWFEWVGLALVVLLELVVLAKRFRAWRADRHHRESSPDRTGQDPRTP